MDETVERIAQIIERRRPVQHVVVNVAKLVAAQRDAELRRIIRHCALVNADGQPVVWAARLLGQYLPERVAGIDLMLRLVEEAPRRAWRIYCLGARPEIVAKTVETFRARHPGLQVAGWRDGYFREDEEEDVAREIARCRADILFVAISSPKKERFLAQWLDTMQAPFTMGVGGSFDVVAGKVRRAPRWMQRCGLEWLFRLLSEPRRMWKRYLVTNTVFLWMLLKALAVERDRTKR